MVAGQQVLGVIVAGGEARRMGGGDKMVLGLKGRPLLAHVIERLAPQVAALVLNANGDPARFAAFGLPVLADPVPGHPGPLAGVLAGLEAAARMGLPRILTVPGDVPGLPRDLCARLAAALDDVGAQQRIAIAASGGQSHPVVALWPSTLAGALRAALTAGDVRKVGLFQAAYDPLAVAWPALPFDPFFNINSPDDLAAAEQAKELSP